MKTPEEMSDRIATALINKYPYDERARLRDAIANAIREANEAGYARAIEDAEKACEQWRDRRISDAESGINKYPHLLLAEASGASWCSGVIRALAPKQEDE